jgi:hypothetical protein
VRALLPIPSRAAPLLPSSRLRQQPGPACFVASLLPWSEAARKRLLAQPVRHGAQTLRKFLRLPILDHRSRRQRPGQGQSACFRYRRGVSRAPNFVLACANSAACRMPHVSGRFFMSEPSFRPSISPGTVSARALGVVFACARAPRADRRPVAGRERCAPLTPLKHCREI